MKIFLVFQKEGETYATLPKDVEIITLFRFIRGSPNIAHIMARCKDVLDKADVDKDFIVYNGPSYLCAIAGYVWLTQDNRTKTNFFSFNKVTQAYCKHEDLIESEAESIDPDKEDEA